MTDLQRAKKIRMINTLLMEAAKQMREIAAEDKRTYSATNRGSMKARDRVGVVRLMQADQIELMTHKLEDMKECAIGRSRLSFSSRSSHTQKVKVFENLN